MANTSKKVLDALSRLYRIVEAGEKGFATVAAGTQNLGLKLLFKSYAQQRSQFKAEIFDHLQSLGRNMNPGKSLAGMIHRGRVVIFAAMTIEDDKRERVVLKEAALGEKYAINTYRAALEQDLPDTTRQVIEGQFEQVKKVGEQINMMLGRDEKRIVVRLFPSAPDAGMAIEALEYAGFPKEDIEKLALEQSFGPYRGRGATVGETVLSGMVGATLWGTLIGLLAGFGAEKTLNLSWLGIDSAVGTFVLVALLTIVTAAVVGGLLGLVIGMGTSEQDTVEYRQSLQPGGVILSGKFDAARAQEATAIMDQVK